MTFGYLCRCATIRVVCCLKKMAVSGSRSALSLGQRMWNALSAWNTKSAGYQRYGMLISFVHSLQFSLAGACFTKMLQNISQVREYFVYRDDHGLGSMAIHLAHHCFSFNMRSI